MKKKPRSLWEGAKYLASKAWENRDTIANLAMQAAPFLLADDCEEHADDAVHYVVRENYRIAIRNAMVSCERL